MAGICVRQKVATEPEFKTKNVGLRLSCQHFLLF